MTILPGNTLARAAVVALAAVLPGAAWAWAMDGGGDVRIATTPQVAVYAGYYDTHHPGIPRPKPDPWAGAPDVDFIGTDDGDGVNWDTSAIRIDNLSGHTLTGVSVIVIIGSRFYDFWPSDDLGPGRRLVIAQLGESTFDGSDTNPAGCPTCSPNDCSQVLSTIPEVDVTIAGVMTKYFDIGQILNTGGVDAAGCPYTGTRNDESRDWAQIFPQTTSNTGVAEAIDSVAISRRAWVGPNPAHAMTVVHFRAVQAGRARVTVFDAAGRRVAAREEPFVEAGDHAWPLALGTVPAGVYRCVLAWPGGATARNVVVVR